MINRIIEILIHALQLIWSKVKLYSMPSLATTISALLYLFIAVLIGHYDDLKMVQLILTLSAGVVVLGSVVFLILLLIPFHLLSVGRWNHQWWPYLLLGTSLPTLGLIGVDLFTGGWSDVLNYFNAVGLGSCMTLTFWYFLRSKKR